MKQYNFKINGNEYNVTINSVDGNVADVTVVASYKVELGTGMAPISVQSAPAQQAAVQAPVQAAPAAAPAPAPQAVPAAAPAPQAAPAAAPAASGAGKAVTAPLPGNIVGISVKVGDTVKAGQQVAVLEAMKMENTIESPVAGTVTAVHVNVGDSVPADAPIVTIG